MILAAADAGLENPGDPRPQLRVPEGKSGVPSPPADASPPDSTTTVQRPSRMSYRPGTPHLFGKRRERAPSPPSAWGSCGPPDLVLVRKFHLEAAARNCSPRPRANHLPRPPSEPGTERLLAPPPTPRGNVEEKGTASGRWGGWRRRGQARCKASPLSPVGISAMNYTFQSMMNFISMTGILH